MDDVALTCRQHLVRLHLARRWGQILEQSGHGTQLAKASRQVLRAVNLSHLDPLPLELHKFLRVSSAPDSREFVRHPKDNPLDFEVGPSPGQVVLQVKSFFINPVRLVVELTKFHHLVC